MEFTEIILHYQKEGVKVQDLEIDNLENYILLLAKGAMEKAYLDTLLSGDGVLEAIGNAVFEVFADGSKKKIKNVPESIKVDINKKIVLQ